MRREVPEIGWGDFTVLKTGKPEILAMRYDWRNNSVLFLHNLSPIPHEARIDPDVDPELGRYLINLLSGDHSQVEAGEKHCILLEPYGYRWYRIGGLDYLLNRTDF
jgi:maltose alpha-D-glucosyltransferase/alpha-amylase